MTTVGTTRTRSVSRVVTLVLLTAAAVASGQSLSTPTFVDNSNPPELFLGSAANASFERESTVQQVSSPMGAFTTRYFSLITTDADGAGSAGALEPQASDYTINFSVSAPGAYQLLVDTRLTGDLNLNNDGTNGAQADISGVNGINTGGSVVSGSLSLADPGIVSGTLGGNVSFNSMGSATVFGVSNGATIPHSLRFTFLQSAQTDPNNGDEAAVRLGGTSDVPSETAGDYPGSPARTQSNDGHFVTVTLVNLCGNSVIDSGPSYTEDCDEGPANGTSTSCCATNCTFKSTGTGCDDSDACTTGETCTAGVCGGGATVTCPLCQTCTPLGGCAIGPRTSCKLPTVPGKTSLQFTDRTPDIGDQLSFKWQKGQGTQTADFALCVFDSLGGLMLQSNAPADGTCGTKPCWKVQGLTGFGYKDSLQTPDGVDKIKLKAGLPGRAKTQFKAKGQNIPPFTLPLTLPVTVQLQSENGQCWAASFSAAGVSKNDSARFKGKSD
jgi:hypothetical protein